MAQLSVAEAADRLGVNIQRVHQRIADGSLRAIRVGRQWVIDDVDLVQVKGRRVGRPLSAKSAWLLALIAQGAGDQPLPEWFSPSERSRARSRLSRLLDQVAVQSESDADADSLDQELAESLRLLLSGRAERRVYRAARADLEGLRSDLRLRLAGLSLPASGIASADVVEGYVSQSDLAGLQGDFLLVEARPGDANVVFHVVSPPVPVDSVRPDNWLVLAADLSEYYRPRERGRAIELLRNVAALAGSGVDAS